MSDEVRVRFAGTEVTAQRGPAPRDPVADARQALRALAVASAVADKVYAVTRQRRYMAEPPRPRFGPGVAFEEIESPAAARPIYAGAPGVAVGSAGAPDDEEPGAVRVLSPNQSIDAYEVAWKRAVDAMAALDLARADPEQEDLLGADDHRVKLPPYRTW